MDLKDLALRLVLDWLPLRDVVRCGHVCSRWRGVAKDPDFWRNKRLKLKEFDDCLAVVSFAPCLGEFEVNLWGLEMAQSMSHAFNSDGNEHEDEHFLERCAINTYSDDLVEVIRKSGIKITKLDLHSGSQSAVDSLLLAVSAHIVELEIYDITDIGNVLFMPKLRVLKIKKSFRGRLQGKPGSSSTGSPEVLVRELPSYTGSLEVLEFHYSKCNLPLGVIHQNASTIQELCLGEVSWDELHVVLKLKRLRMLEVFRIIGVAPKPLPTIECQIEILKFGPHPMWRDCDPSTRVFAATNLNALLDLVSSSLGLLSELIVHSPSNIMFTHLAAMPKLRRLILVTCSPHHAMLNGTCKCCPLNFSPIAPVESAIAPVEYLNMEGFDIPDIASVLKTFAATLQEARLRLSYDDYVTLAMLPTPGRGGSVDRPPGSLQIDYICLQSSGLALTLPLLPLFAATLRKISIFPSRYSFSWTQFSVLSDFLSYIVQHNSGELQQVEILYDPIKNREGKNLNLQLQPLRQKVQNLTIRPYSEHELRRFLNLFM